MSEHRPCTEPRACKSCGAQILWVITAKGKSMPVDAHPTPIGGFILTHNKRADRLLATYVKSMPPEEQAELGTRNRWESHWATCPNATEHRKPKDEPHCESCGVVGELYAGTGLCQPCATGEANF